jgi:hypothetical protein
MTSNGTAAVEDTTIPNPSRERSAAHRRLDAFVGTWNTEGRQNEGPFGPAAEISALESYEWLTGSCFLVHRFEGRVGDSVAACIEILGDDAQHEGLSAQTFYNDGLRRQWRLRERDGTWTLTEDSPIESSPMKVRLTTVFSDGGKTMNGTWEHSRDGSDWQVFWDVKATKTDKDSST